VLTTNDIAEFGFAAVAGCKMTPFGGSLIWPNARLQAIWQASSAILQDLLKCLSVGLAVKAQFQGLIGDELCVNPESVSAF